MNLSNKQKELILLRSKWKPFGKALIDNKGITSSNEDTVVPYSWTDTICAGLASKLAIKYQPEKFQLLNEMYERSFSFAASSDNDGVSLRVQPTALNLM